MTDDPKANDSKPWTDKQRLDFTKQIEYIFEVSHPRWRRILLFSFVKGMATGLGVFLGGTIMVALLLWLLSGLGHVPFLDDVVHPVQDTLQQDRN